MAKAITRVHNHVTGAPGFFAEVIFKEIEASQRKFAERAVKWDLDTNVSRRMAYNHYFSGQKPAAKKA